jgi:pimeloyl-ACP methyl ester carboxylesterase
MSHHNATVCLWCVVYTHRWVAHSLGSCLVAAIQKAKPELVQSLVLIDPVCFLLWEVDVLENFCYRQVQLRS